MEHEHHHSQKVSSLNSAFIIGISLNIIFVLIEFIVGFFNNSVGLLSDAGHNLSDVASLILAMFAFKLSKIQPNKRYTYGYKKSTVLVSFINAVVLLITVGFIITESINNIITPQAVQGSVIAWVAGVGVVVNAATAFLFMKDKEKDLNVKGAYLHMMADAIVSVGVVVSGIVIYFTDWFFIDSIIGQLVAAVIIVSTWDLLKDSIRLSLDGVPESVDYEKICQIFLSEPDVVEYHHLHIWAISTTENALTVHIVVDDVDKIDNVKHSLKHKLSDAGVCHATIEFENKGNVCKECYCHDF